MRLRMVTRLKKTALVLAICALTLFILLPAVSPVNTSTSGILVTDKVLYTWGNTTLVADGEPLPPPIPPNPKFSETNLLVADGEPLPPPIPPNPTFPETPPL